MVVWQIFLIDGSKLRFLTVLSCFIITREIIFILKITPLNQLYLTYSKQTYQLLLERGSKLRRIFVYVLHCIQRGQMLLFFSSKEVVTGLSKQHLWAKWENNFIVETGKRLFREAEWSLQGSCGLPWGCANFLPTLSKTEQCWGQGENSSAATRRKAKPFAKEVLPLSNTTTNTLLHRAWEWRCGGEHCCMAHSTQHT